MTGRRAGADGEAVVSVVGGGADAGWPGVAAASSDGPEPVAGEAGDDPDQPAVSGRAGWRRWLAALVCLVVVAGTSWWLGSRVTSPEEAASRAEPPEPSVVTAPVERRPLQEAVVTRGTVAAPAGAPLRLSGAVRAEDPLVTRVEVAVGQPVEEGDVVLEVSARPVFVLAGGLPMYRDLVEGDEGEDVRQLQSALARLGYLDGVDGEFGPATATAVRELYENRGFEPVVEAAPAPAGAGSDPSRGQGPPTSPPAPGVPVTEPPERVVLPRGEVVFTPSLPATVTSVEAQVGTAPGATVAHLATGSLELEVPITSTQAQFVRPGAEAVIDHPDGTGLEATVARVGAAPAADEASPPASEPDGAASGAPSGEASGTTAAPPGPTEPAAAPGEEVVAVIAPTEPLPRGLAGQSLRVTIRTASSSTPQLVVPVTAVRERADGEASVVVRGPDGDERVVAVDTLGAAGGYVAISGEVDEGDRVVVTR